MLRLAWIFRHRAAARSDSRMGGREGFTPRAGATAGWYWMQHPMVRNRINLLISGNRQTDAYDRLAGFLGDRGQPFLLGRCASLGCGSGGLERDLVRRGMVGDIEGYDPSEEAVSEARRLAADLGCGNIHYYTVDLASLDLPEAQFDAIFTHSSLHAVEALEGVVATVRRALKPSGVFHLNEFVGPSRFQWIDAQVRLINAFLDTLPDRLLQTPGGRKPPVQRPTVDHMLAAHPTQAVRSSEIREVLTRHFEIIEERPVGGTLLHMGLSDIAQNFDEENPEDVAHLERFFDLEDHVLTGGTLGSDFTVITAVPAPAFRGNGGGLGAPAGPGFSPTRQLLPPPGLACPSLNLASLNLTVSKADTMLSGNDGHYLAVGLSALAAVERALDGTEPRNILDLPCGFGRVTRALRARFSHAAITVSDLDVAGVDFSAREFNARAAYSVRDFRELNLDECVRPYLGWLPDDPFASRADETPTRGPRAPPVTRRHRARHAAWTRHHPAPARDWLWPASGRRRSGDRGIRAQWLRLLRLPGREGPVWRVANQRQLRYFSRGRSLGLAPRWRKAASGCAHTRCRDGTVTTTSPRRGLRSGARKGHRRYSSSKSAPTA